MSDPVINDLMRHLRAIDSDEHHSAAAAHYRREYLRLPGVIADAASRTEQTVALATEALAHVWAGEFEAARAAVGHMLEAAAIDYAAGKPIHHMEKAA